MGNGYTQVIRCWRHAGGETVVYRDLETKLVRDADMKKIWKQTWSFVCYPRKLTATIVARIATAAGKIYAEATVICV